MIIYFLLVLFSLILSILVIFFLIAEMLASVNSEAPFVPMPEQIFEPLVLSLGLKDESILYDLGCGDARVLQKISGLYPKIKLVGIERAIFPYLLARFNIRKNKNVEIRRENFFNSDMEEATHIFAYLYPKGMEKLMPILEKKCKPGTIVISCDFEDKNREALKTIHINTLAKRGKKLIVYKL